MPPASAEGHTRRARHQLIFVSDIGVELELGRIPPVNADNHEYEGGEDVAAGSEHHEDLAHDVPRVPLDGQPPEGLHRQRDEANDGVGQSEMEHQVVNIGPGLGGGQRGLAARDHQGDAVENYANCNNTKCTLILKYTNICMEF